MFSDGDREQKRRRLLRAAGMLSGLLVLSGCSDSGPGTLAPPAAPPASSTARSANAEAPSLAVSSPSASALVELGRLKIKGLLPLDIAVAGQYAYLAGSRDGVLILDVSDPRSPRQVGRIPTLGEARGVAVSGHYAYVADYVEEAERNGLLIADVSKPQAPTVVGRFNTFLVGIGQAEGVAVSGNLAYLADGSNGLLVLDVSQPASPVLRVRGPYGSVSSVAVAGRYAYFADAAGLMITHAPPLSMQDVVGLLDKPSFVRSGKIAVRPPYVYLCHPQELAIVDVSRSEAPALAGALATKAASGVALGRSYLYLADQWDGLLAVDVSNPASPRPVARLAVGSAKSVAVQGDYVYVGVPGAFVVVSALR